MSFTRSYSGSSLKHAVVLCVFCFDGLFYPELIRVLIEANQKRVVWGRECRFYPELIRVLIEASDREAFFTSTTRFYPELIRVLIEAQPHAVALTD